MLLFVAGASIARIFSAYFTAKLLGVMEVLTLSAEEDLNLPAFPIGDIQTFARVMAYVVTFLASGSLLYLLVG